MRGLPQCGSIARAQRRRDCRKLAISAPDERIREITREFLIAIKRFQQSKREA